MRWESEQWPLTTHSWTCLTLRRTTRTNSRPWWWCADSSMWFLLCFTSTLLLQLRRLNSTDIVYLLIVMVDGRNDVVAWVIYLTAIFSLYPLTIGSTTNFQWGWNGQHLGLTRRWKRCCSAMSIQYYKYIVLPTWSCMNWWKIGRWSPEWERYASMDSVWYYRQCLCCCICRICSENYRWTYGWSFPSNRFFC